MLSNLFKKPVGGGYFKSIAYTSLRNKVLGEANETEWDKVISFILTSTTVRGVMWIELTDFLSVIDAILEKRL